MPVSWPLAMTPDRTRWRTLTLWPGIKARRQRSVEADALDRSTSRALDDHDLTDAVRPRPHPMGDQHGEKNSHHEQKGQNTAGELHLYPFGVRGTLH